jgi:hypothetical protein
LASLLKKTNFDTLEHAAKQKENTKLPKEIAIFLLNLAFLFVWPFGDSAVGL